MVYSRHCNTATLPPPPHRVVRCTKSVVMDECQTVMHWHTRFRRLVCGSRSGWISLWALDHSVQRDRAPTRLHTAPITDMASSSEEESWLITGSLDGFVKVFDIVEAVVLITIPTAVRGGVTFLALHVDTSLIFTAGVDNELLVWSLKMPNKRPVRLLDNLRPHRGAIIGIYVWPNTSYLLSADTKGNVKVWDVRTFACLYTKTLPTYDGHSPLSCLTGLPGHRMVWVAGRGLSCVCRRAIRYPLHADDSACTHLLRNVPTNGFVTIHINSSIKQWDYRGHVVGLTEPILDTLTEEVTAVCLEPRGRRIFLGTSSGTVIVANVSTGEQLERLTPWTSLPSSSSNPPSPRSHNLCVWSTAEGTRLSTAHSKWTQPPPSRKTLIRSRGGPRAATDLQSDHGILRVGTSSSVPRGYDSHDVNSSELLLPILPYSGQSLDSSRSAHETSSRSKPQSDIMCIVYASMGGSETRCFVVIYRRSVFVVLDTHQQEKEDKACMDNSSASRFDTPRIQPLACVNAILDPDSKDTLWDDPIDTTEWQDSFPGAKKECCVIPEALTAFMLDDGVRMLLLLDAYAMLLVNIQDQTIIVRYHTTLSVSVLACDVDLSHRYVVLACESTQLNLICLDSTPDGAILQLNNSDKNESATIRRRTSLNGRKNSAVYPRGPNKLKPRTCHPVTWQHVTKCMSITSVASVKNQWFLIVSDDTGNVVCYDTIHALLDTIDSNDTEMVSVAAKWIIPSKESIQTVLTWKGGLFNAMSFPQAGNDEVSAKTRRSSLHLPVDALNPLQREIQDPSALVDVVLCADSTGPVSVYSILGHRLGYLAQGPSDRTRRNFSHNFMRASDCDVALLQLREYVAEHHAPYRHITTYRGEEPSFKYSAGIKTLPRQPSTRSSPLRSAYNHGSDPRSPYAPSRNSSGGPARQDSIVPQRPPYIHAGTEVTRPHVGKPLLNVPAPMNRWNVPERAVLARERQGVCNTPPVPKASSEARRNDDRFNYPSFFLTQSCAEAGEVAEARTRNRITTEWLGSPRTSVQRSFDHTDRSPLLYESRTSLYSSSMRRPDKGVRLFQNEHPKRKSLSVKDRGQNEYVPRRVTVRLPETHRACSSMVSRGKPLPQLCPVPMSQEIGSSTAYFRGQRSPVAQSLDRGMDEAYVKRNSIVPRLSCPAPLTRSVSASMNLSRSARKLLHRLGLDRDSDMGENELAFQTRGFLVLQETPYLDEPSPRMVFDR